VQKFKRLRQRLSISAPRVTVKTHIGWRMKSLLLVVLVAVAAVSGTWLYEAGARVAGFGENFRSEVAQLRENNKTLKAQNEQLAAAASAAESRLDIERSTQAQLGNQIMALERENAKLKDDAAFFENLSSVGPATGLAIKRLQVEKDAVPGQMHYRMLITQGGKFDHDFVGEFQLIVTLQQQGKTVIMNLPNGSPGTDGNAFQMSFRFFKRVEGDFQIPPGASVKQVQARILAKGVVRAQQTVMLD